MSTRVATDEDGTSKLSRAATIYDVAARAKVSHQTVSRYLRKYPGIRPETRERVELALAELNYRPNQAARTLATNRSLRIGAFAYEMLEVGPSQIMQGASRRARDAGYMLDLVTLFPSDDEATQNAINEMYQQNLAGVIASAPTDRVREALEAADFGVPLYIETEREDELGAEHESLNAVGTRKLVDHLVDQGHTTILNIAGPPSWIASLNRVNAYRRAMLHRGLEPLDSLHTDWSAASGYKLARQMPLDRGVTAIVATNDQVALGVVRALIERGVAVPDDMSVVGFDDIPESEFFLPPLTTVQTHFDMQGKYSIDMLLSMIHNSEAPVREDYVSADLVLRSSTARAPVA
ncbi:LacI family DNA-binding transcriptional regulator [Salinibacterium sp. UTAS2018]|uniref:LacI family DNA-binding transcriptional regulator n=1 Tax=Salinibacterium sp. UTAS2018 TaxID=2508880 RepID=UPI00143D3E69|nr:LacI family DNA-binding transcriptional regulator [Salinibacterium sp. UTAS2018]